MMGDCSCACRVYCMSSVCCMRLASSGGGAPEPQARANPVHPPPPRRIHKACFNPLSTNLGPHGSRLLQSPLG